MSSSLDTVRTCSKKGLFLLIALILPSIAEPQKRPVRIAYSSTSTVAATDLRKALAATCPDVLLTTDPLRSDFALEALAGTGNIVYPTEITRYRFTLFDRSGNTVISTAPHKFSTAIHKLCRAIFDQNEKGDAEVGDDEPRLQSTGATPD